MNRKLVFLATLMLFLSGISLATLEVQRVEASGTVYIRADGSIDPPTAPIGSLDNVTYTFTGNIKDSIVIDRNNTVIDGSGYTVTGTKTYGSKGIDLTGRSNVTVKNINIAAFWYGVYLNSSSSNSVDGNNMANNVYGIGLDCSSNNSVSRNNVTANILYGIRLYSSSDNSVSGNNITANNMVGIELGSYSSNNSVTGNDVANTYYGTSLYYSSDNSVYHNNFINNAWRVASEASINVWDDGYPSGGNYWSDYNGTDADQDGISDTQYIIDADNNDRYPLMGMFSDFNAASDQHVTTICNSTISDFQFNRTAITFDVTGVEGTPGFCRICVPTSLMATYRVFVNGTEVSCNLLPCSNSTHSYLYFNYTHSTQEVIIIPEFPSFLILPLFCIATLSVVIVHKRKHPQNE